MPALLKSCESMKSDTLYLKTIIIELDYLKMKISLNEMTKKKDLQLFATKLTEKISAPYNAKEHYQSIIKK